MHAAERYDYLIAGAGAAGLSLLWHLLCSPALRQKRILLIDRSDKQDAASARTWCFWQRGESPYETALAHVWDEITVAGPNEERHIPLEDYRYKMLRGADFYALVLNRARQHPNVTFVQAPIQRLEDTAKGVTAHTAAGAFSARWAFSSLWRQAELNITQHHWLLQHFKGWFLKAPRPVFNPQRATMMDFDLPQEGYVRFGYVLPTSETEALVEFTLFSPSLLPKADYAPLLEGYLHDRFGLRKDQVEIVEPEFGVIPMTDGPFPRQEGRHIIRLGTAGGQTKASSGYTFQNIQRHSTQLITALERSGKPYVKQSLWQQRFGWYDRLLLHILARQTHEGRDIFLRMFRHHPIGRIFRFLDGESSFAEELRVMSTSPIQPFLWALVAETFRKREPFVKSPQKADIGKLNAPTAGFTR